MTSYNFWWFLTHLPTLKSDVINGRFLIQTPTKWALLCLVLLQVPKCFLVVQIFWTSPKIWLHLVPLQKLLCQHKKQFYWMQIIFWSGAKCLWLSQYVNKFLVRHKKFGLAQNILGPVKGQGINQQFKLKTKEIGQNKFEC